MNETPKSPRLKNWPKKHRYHDFLLCGMIFGHLSLPLIFWQFYHKSLTWIEGGSLTQPPFAVTVPGGKGRYNLPRQKSPSLADSWRLWTMDTHRTSCESWNCMPQMMGTATDHAGDWPCFRDQWGIGRSWNPSLHCLGRCSSSSSRNLLSWICMKVLQKNDP